MPSRSLTAAAVLAAALATLTSCRSGGTAASAPPTAAASAPVSTQAAEPSGAPAPDALPDPAASRAAVSEAPSAAASGAGDLPLDPEPSFDCTEPRLATGHRVVQVTGVPAGGLLPLRTATFSCDPDGGGYAGTGKAVRYPLAPGATAELAAVSTPRPVSIAELSRHISACLAHAEVAPPLSCSGDLYEITVTSGRISDLREIWHP
ncbi:hypothetical protein [Peterkaempfera griseoplana]|uniref:hypothetical protein n=1 Tax=Peterkaempfera griseoplana TaxID=66896 RepID=UPI0006E160DE|nr:hypothetical protein [Peterkaempfera griseoplana]